MKLKEIGEEAFATNKEKGFLGTSIPTHIGLLHSEISEAFESHRKGEPDYFYGGDGKPEGFLAELADEVIRIASLCEEHHLDLTQAVREKLAYNKTRPHKHGGKKF